MTLGQMVASLRPVGRVAGVAACVALAAACEDATDPGGIAGTYELVEANGQALPAVVFSGPTDYGEMVATALSGSMTLRSSTYTERVVFDVTVDGQPFPGGGSSIVVDGTYAADGEILDFDPDRASSANFAGTLMGGVLTTVEVDPDFGELELVWMR